MINVSRFAGRAAVSAVALFGLGCGGSAPPVPGPESRIARDIAYLSSATLGGRAAGSPGSVEAAKYLTARYSQLGLAGAFPGRCPAMPCEPVYAQSFNVEYGGASNIAAVLPGSDPKLRGTWVVIGAHRDHIGTLAKYSRDPERGMVTRPGADDNASGTAAVLELARRLVANPPPRSVLAMVNFDMVGRLRKDDLTIDLPPNAKGFMAILDSLAAAGRLHLQFTTEFSDRSDHAPFDQKLVPAFTLFTGPHPDYHTAMDIAVRVNTNGVARIVDLVEQLVRQQRPRA